MSTLIILLTDEINEAIDTEMVDLEVIQIFGQESIVVNGSIFIDGQSAMVSGEPEEFRKLVHIVGDLWTSNNPMLGEWEQVVKDEEALV